jgi:hypothetical protein
MSDLIIFTIQTPQKAPLKRDEHARAIRRNRSESVLIQWFISLGLPTISVSIAGKTKVKDMSTFW